MSAIQIIQDHSPLVITNIRGVPTDDELKVLLDVLSSFLDTKQKHAFVFDCTESALPPSSHHRRAGMWLRENREPWKRYATACAIAFSSPSFRFVLSAIFMIQPMPVPYFVCATRAEGLAWAAGKLKSAGVAVRVPHEPANPAVFRSSAAALKTAPRKSITP